MQSFLRKHLRGTEHNDCLRASPARLHPLTRVKRQGQAMAGAGCHPYKYRFLEKKVERKRISSTGERHGSRITIHTDMLTSLKPLSGDTCAKNSRNMILAGYNRTMTEWAAHISHYPCGQGKEWRPGGRRDPGYQDLPVSHLCELISAMNDPRYASDISRAGCDSFQHIPCWLTGTGGQ